jgi:hypothetical protein
VFVLFANLNLSESDEYWHPVDRCLYTEIKRDCGEEIKVDSKKFEISELNEKKELIAVKKNSVIQGDFECDKCLKEKNKRLRKKNKEISKKKDLKIRPLILKEYAKFILNPHLDLSDYGNFFFLFFFFELKHCIYLFIFNLPKMMMKMLTSEITYWTLMTTMMMMNLQLTNIWMNISAPKMKSVYISMNERYVTISHHQWLQQMR